MERQLPKNVRQIGNVSDSPKIYVEDYVDTFFAGLCEKCEKAGTDPMGAFLVGDIQNGEDEDYVYIYGAIQMHDLKMSDKEYVIEQVMTYADKPDMQKLERQYYGAVADRIIASFKDENGIRDCFAVKDNQNKTKYIDISKPMLLTREEIDAVKIKQKKLSRGAISVVRKGSSGLFRFRPVVSRRSG